MAESSFFDLDAAFQSDDYDLSFLPAATPQESYSILSSRKRFFPESTHTCSFSNSPDDHCSYFVANSTKKLNTTNSINAYDYIDHEQVVTTNSFPKLISFGNSINTSSPVIISQQFNNNNNMDGKVKVVPKPKIENLNFETVVTQGDLVDRSLLNYGTKPENKLGATAMRGPTQARDHVIAERKRRENLSQKFCALSAILPGLKKNDKASILEDAIKHLKELQERVKSLEEQVADRTVESAVLVKKSVVFSNDDDQSVLPEIEARVSGKNMLFRIHCDKHRIRAATAILCELEKHHLTIQSSTVLPFGNHTLEITIVAQMNTEECLGIKDLIRRLSQAIKA